MGDNFCLGSISKKWVAAFCRFTSMLVFALTLANLESSFGSEPSIEIPEFENLWNSTFISKYIKEDLNKLASRSYNLTWIELPDRFFELLINGLENKPEFPSNQDAHLSYKKELGISLGEGRTQVFLIKESAISSLYKIPDRQRIVNGLFRHEIFRNMQIEDGSYQSSSILALFEKERPPEDIAKILEEYVATQIKNSPNQKLAGGSGVGGPGNIGLLTFKLGLLEDMIQIVSKNKDLCPPPADIDLKKTLVEVLERPMKVYRPNERKVTDMKSGASKIREELLILPGYVKYANTDVQKRKRNRILKKMIVCASPSDKDERPSPRPTDLHQNDTVAAIPNKVIFLGIL